jgi:hypothetical protein
MNIGDKVIMNDKYKVAEANKGKILRSGVNRGIYAEQSACF